MGSLLVHKECACMHACIYVCIHVTSITWSLVYVIQISNLFIPAWKFWDKELGFERTKSDRCWGRIGLRGGREGRDGLQFGESSSSLPRGGSLLHQIAVQHPTPCLVTQGWCPWQHFYTNNAGQPFTSWPPKFLVRYLWKKLIFVCLCGTWHGKHIPSWWPWPQSGEKGIVR